MISPVAQFAVELKSSAQPAKEVSLKRSIWKPAEFMPFMNAQLCLVARHDVTLDSVQNTNTKKQKTKNTNIKYKYKIQIQNTKYK